jgi:hypothetical protein
MIGANHANQNPQSFRYFLFDTAMTFQAQNSCTVRPAIVREIYALCFTNYLDRFVFRGVGQGWR